MSTPAHPESTGIVLDLDDAGAILAYGQAALDDGLGKRIANAILQTPVAALADALQQIHQALQAQDPARLRKSVGWFGRLLGKDIELQARVEQLQAQIGVLLATADAKSQALAAHALELDKLHQALAAADAKLGGCIEAGRHFLAAHPQAGLHGDLPTPPRERFQQRLNHLDAVRASQDISARQLDLMRDQVQTLRVRHGRLRDLLVPALRQNALAGLQLTVLQNAITAEHLLDASSAPGSGSFATAAADPMPHTPPNSTKEQAP